MKTQGDQLKSSMAKALQAGGRVTVLTGAGVSAESGIPTFRGPEGYWTVGSRNYQPSEIATEAMLHQHPEEVWKWFLFRRGVCAKALPNPGHLAIYEMERKLGNRFRLITQNVDGLHLRAGNTIARTYQIHGNLNVMRCQRECSSEVYPIPESMPAKARGDELSSAEKDLLKCPACGAMTRPHVLFWDEYYNEPHYRYESSLRAAAETSLLIIVGTTGSTTLPNQVATIVLQRGATIFDVNIEKNVFSEIALRSPGGRFLQGRSSDILPRLFDIIDALISDDRPKRNS
jgi:NAD-dependent deacetylase